MLTSCCCAVGCGVAAVAVVVVVDGVVVVVAAVVDDDFDESFVLPLSFSFSFSFSFDCAFGVGLDVVVAVRLNVVFEPGLLVFGAAPVANRFTADVVVVEFVDGFVVAVTERPEFRGLRLRLREPFVLFLFIRLCLYVYIVCCFNARFS